MRQVCLALAIIWFLIQALPTQVGGDAGQATFELIQRMGLGLALIAAAFIRWPPVDGLFGLDSGAAHRDEPPTT